MTKGIVPESAQQEFNFFVKNTLQRKILDTVRGEINSFNEHSVRVEKKNYELNLHRQYQSSDQKTIEKVTMEKSFYNESFNINNILMESE